MPGRVHAPEGDRGRGDSTAIERGGRRDGERGGYDGRAGEREADRKQSAAPVGEAAEQRVEHDLDEAGGEEHGADRERRPARVVERERGEDGERPEEQGRQRVQPEAADEAAVRERRGGGPRA